MMSTIKVGKDCISPLRTRISILILLTIVFIATGCTGEKKYGEIGVQQSNRAEFFASIKQYPYTKNGEQVQSVIQGYQDIQLGLTEKNVIELLGPPDVKTESYKIVGKEQIQTGSSWIYIFYRESPELSSSNDSAIYLYFSVDGELYHTHPVNVDGVNAFGALEDILITKE